MCHSRKKLIEQITRTEACLYACHTAIQSHKNYLKSFITRQESLFVLLIIPLLWGWRQGRLTPRFRQLLRWASSALSLHATRIIRSRVLHALRKQLI